MVKIGKISLSLIGLFTFIAVAISCGPKSLTNSKINEILDIAENQISGIFYDYQEITSSIGDQLISEVEVALYRTVYSVTVSWDTNKRTIISKNGDVSRPDGDKGMPDTVVKITATLSYDAEGTLSSDSRIVSWDLIVKATEPFPGFVLSTITQLYRRYDGIKSSDDDNSENIYKSDFVRIENVVVIIVYDDYYCIQDSFTTIQVNVPNSGRVIGEKGTITGTLDDYDSMPQFGGDSLFEVTSINEDFKYYYNQNGLYYLTPKNSDYNSLNNSIHLLNYENIVLRKKRDYENHKIYSISGVVVLATQNDYPNVWACNDRSNSSLYPSANIDDDDYQLYIADSAINPKKVVRILSSDPKFSEIKAHDGDRIELIAIGYSLTDSYAHISEYSKKESILPIWNISVLSIESVETLSARERAEVDADQLNFQNVFKTPGIISLSAIGEKTSHITWSYTNQSNSYNHLVNLSNGDISLPNLEGEIAIVDITATITNRGESISKIFSFKIGELLVTNIGAIDFSIHNSVDSSILVRIKGTITQVVPYYSNNVISSYSGFIEDETGGLYLSGFSTSYSNLFVDGKTLDISGKVYDSFGRRQMVGVDLFEIVEDIETLIVNPRLISNEDIDLSLLNTRISVTGWVDKIESEYFLILSETIKYKIYIPEVVVTPNFNGYITNASNEELIQKLGNNGSSFLNIVGNLFLEDYFYVFYVISRGQLTTVYSGVSDDLIVMYDKMVLEISKTHFYLPDKIVLPQNGSKHSSIEWSYKDIENEHNQQVNLFTREILMDSSEGTVSVYIVATISRGDIVSTKEFLIIITTPHSEIQTFTWNFQIENKLVDFDKLQGVVGLTYFLGMFNGEHEDYLTYFYTTGAGATYWWAMPVPLPYLILGTANLFGALNMGFANNVIISKVTVLADHLNRDDNSTLNINGNKILLTTDRGTKQSYSIELEKPSNILKFEGTAQLAGSVDHRLIIYSMSFQALVYDIVTE